ncbi:hypothetical protein BEN44_15415 [Leptospira interrogans serovar Ricardi]|nr:hypothetical protein [Leptospira interrogans serovar Yeoncheon]MCR8639966.1 hypothetical protein [Leptospira interrogans serovar Ricardi]
MGTHTRSFNGRELVQRSIKDTILIRIVEKLILHLFLFYVKSAIEAVLLIATMEFFNNSNIVAHTDWKCIFQ